MSEQESPPAWGLIANVVDERLVGEQGVVRRGASQFAGGAKVYFHSAFWGMGAESVTVVGHHRASKKLIKISLDARHLHRWRAKVVYAPAVLRLLADSQIRGSEDEAKRLCAFFAEHIDQWRIRILERPAAEVCELISADPRLDALARERLVALPDSNALVAYDGTACVGLAVISHAGALEVWTDEDHVGTRAWLVDSASRLRQH